MNNVTLAAPENFAAELVRRGLPIEYAERAAAEVSDHRRDLVEEIRAGGLAESAAQLEAGRRLGDSRKIVNRIVSEHRRRHWCGRWPLISFFLSPLPLSLCAWFAASFLSIQLYELAGRIGQWFGIPAPASATIAVLKLILLGGSTAVVAPLLLTVLYFWLARRAGCDRRWALLSVAQIAFLASLLCFHRDSANGRLFFEPAMFGDLFYATTFSEFLQSYFVQPSQALQMALPLAAFAMFAWIERRQRQSCSRRNATSIA